MWVLNPAQLCTQSLTEMLSEPIHECIQQGPQYPWYVPQLESSLAAFGGRL